MKTDTSSFLDHWRHPATVRRAVIVALVVGTILSLINQWQAIFLGMVPIDWLKIVLTYLVPYGVSSYSTAASLKGNENS